MPHAYIFVPFLLSLGLHMCSLFPRILTKAVSFLSVYIYLHLSISLDGLGMEQLGWQVWILVLLYMCECWHWYFGSGWRHQWPETRCWFQARPRACSPLPGGRLCCSYRLKLGTAFRQIVQLFSFLVMLSINTFFCHLCFSFQETGFLLMFLLGCNVLSFTRNILKLFGSRQLSEQKSTSHFVSSWFSKCRSAPPTPNLMQK